MTDREKVIKGLERFIADFKPFCGNKFDWQRVDDALALLKAQEQKCRECGEATSKAIQEFQTKLKAQEPRVMTLEEFNAHWQIPPQERKPIWEEWKIDNGKGKWKLYGRATGGYGDMWRCWTARPTDAQREAVPWE